MHSLVSFEALSDVSLLFHLAGACFVKSSNIRILQVIIGKMCARHVDPLSVFNNCKTMRNNLLRNIKEIKKSVIHTLERNHIYTTGLLKHE